MHRLFWICTGLLFLALAGSHLRTTAVDYQLTRTIWLQAATSEGRVRLVALLGDPSASWTAGTVIDRDKATWQHGLSTGSFGLDVYHATADTLGTPVDTYRFDLPLLQSLMLLLGFALLIWLWKRWGAPPGLILAECWRRDSRKNSLIGAVRGAALFVLTLLAMGTAFLWIGSHLGLPADWSYSGERFAFATTNPHAGFGFKVFDDKVSPAERLDQIVKAKAAEMGETDRHVSIEVTRGKIAVRYFRAGTAQGFPVKRLEYAGAGFYVCEEQLAAPSLQMTVPPYLFAKLGLPLGVERTLIMPSCVWLVLFGLWPVWRFVRGPLRRARHQATGCCRQCGYNLTGLIHPRCPECGAVFGSNVVFAAASRAGTACPGAPGPVTTGVVGIGRDSRASASR